ncbi:hypothetical protein A7A78_13075 [Aequorivita soesokkakensis]|uniref:Peptidase S74 domain-containing protein n=2 Tax=Aequorivita soesokkakensis TaxID=1385699 RepID=A0A1A9LE28_9FLAO|nr:hypothetical protein A7A78_13075 [Aequorivita soesokkakensis]
MQGDAILQLESANKGLLIPRIALTDLTTFAPLTGIPVESLMVYNTSNATGPGYFYWSVTDTEWKPIDGGKDWKRVGNTPTTPGTAPGENYVGTPDTENFILATNDTERITFTSDGLVSVNDNTPAATDRFSVTGPNDHIAVAGYGIGVGGGVYGENTTTGGEGVKGDSPGSIGAIGVGYTGTNVGALAGINTNANGTGIIGLGNNVPEKIIPTGSGAAFSGTQYGTVSWALYTNPSYGYAGAGNGLNLDAEIAANFADNTGGIFKGNQWGITSIAAITGSGNNGTNRATFIGNYVSRNNSQETIYVGARIANTNVKIAGTGGGSVSTTMRTANDGERILFAPEAPENWFFDIGEAQLVNGKATVKLDPLFVEVLSTETPFKVFVQGGENTLGNIQLKRNQETKSFTLEDQGGRSNGTVYYKIYGIWKGKENLRFPELKPEDMPQQVAVPSKKVEAQFDSEKTTALLQSANQE